MYLDHSRSLLGISADEFGNLLKTKDDGIVGIDSQTPSYPHHHHGNIRAAIKL